MQKIIPHLWYDKEAKEAAEFYVSVFEGNPHKSGTQTSRIIGAETLHDTPSGDTESVSFELAGQPFMAISAGPLFKFNESVSFMITCDSQEEIDYFWEKLSAVPESEQCGWVKDKYGLSWQIVPKDMEELLRTPEAVQAMLKMKKIDIAELERAAS